MMNTPTDEQHPDQSDEVAYLYRKHAEKQAHAEWRERTQVFLRSLDPLFLQQLRDAEVLDGEVLDELWRRERALEALEHDREEALRDGGERAAKWGVARERQRLRSRYSAPLMAALNDTLNDEDRRLLRDLLSVIGDGGLGP